MSYKYTPEEIGHLNAEIDRLRKGYAQAATHGAELMRQAVLETLPGGQSCDPQAIADTIRTLKIPGTVEQSPQEK